MYLRFFKQLAISALNFYQRYIRISLPVSCRFYPSCSEYAKQAILKYGLAKGIYIALGRLSRCHPLSGRQGFDPLQ